ncbi:MAG: heavy metal-binding domain-containing protein [Betaproteobacteria bacterium]
MVQEHKRISGLSGNEIYFLERMGYRPGQLCIGNSVVALGVLKGIGAGLSTLGGGEIEEVTQLVHDGRTNAFNRMMEEASHYGGVGLTGVSFDLINHGGNIEFITVGSTIHLKDGREGLRFSTSADVAKLYCQVDAGFSPIKFVFGNVAYSIGLGGSIMGGLRGLARGEVTEYTEIFDRTRHLALTRITDEAKRCKANAVVGIETTISPLLGSQEMIMVGTASHHPAIDAFDMKPVTSDMTNEEMWNMVNVGFLPIRLVMGVSVYSLGLKGGIFSALQSLGGGQVSGLTEILYEAREKALARIEVDAERCGADEVIGVKTHIYDLGGGLIEFMAIGTAVRKIAGVKTKSASLPPQAILQDRDTFIDASDSLGTTIEMGRSSAASSKKLQAGPRAIIIAVLAFIFYVFLYFFRH